MSLEPKIIDHPGAGKIQEMTLDQYLSALSPDHLARKQLDEIRGQALKTVDLSTQLLAANEKILELQNRLIAALPAQPLVSPEAAAAAQQLMAYPPQGGARPIPEANPGFVCAICGHAVKSAAGLQLHIFRKHGSSTKIKDGQVTPVAP